MLLAEFFVQLLQNPRLMETFLADPITFIDRIDLSNEDRNLILQSINKESFINPEQQETSIVYVIQYAVESREKTVTHEAGITTLKKTKLTLSWPKKTVIIWGTWNVKTGGINMTIQMPKMGRNDEEWITYELRTKESNNITHKEGVTIASETRVKPINEGARKIARKYYISGKMDVHTGKVEITFRMEKIKDRYKGDVPS